MKKKDLKSLLKLLKSNPKLLDSILKKKSSSITVDAWMDIYEETMLGQSEYKQQTIRNRKAIFKHIRCFWGTTRLDELKPFEITASLKDIRATHPSTSQRILAELRQVYQEAIANNYVETNPALHVKNFRVRVQRSRLRYDTWCKMYFHAKRNMPQKWIHILLLLALVTGQRRADLAKMKYSDIKDGYLYIEQQKHAGKGYGARVALPLTLRLNIIKMTLGEVIERSKRSAPKGETILRQANGNALELSSLSIRFCECLKSVSDEDTFPEGTRPSLHEIRSLSARLYTKQGLDTQTLLGHKHAEMTSMYTDDRGLGARVYKKLVI
jgi:enterobacteria phage integrase